MKTVTIPIEVPVTMDLPQSVPTLGVTGLSVTPNPDGSIGFTLTVHPGTIALSSKSATVNVPAILKFIQDLVAVLPSLIADLMAIFPATKTEGQFVLSTPIVDKN